MGVRIETTKDLISYSRTLLYLSFALSNSIFISNAVPEKLSVIKKKQSFFGGPGFRLALTFGLIISGTMVTTWRASYCAYRSVGGVLICYAVHLGMFFWVGLSSQEVSLDSEYPGGVEKVRRYSDTFLVLLTIQTSRSSFLLIY